MIMHNLSVAYKVRTNNNKEIQVSPFIGYLTAN